MQERKDSGKELCWKGGHHERRDAGPKKRMYPFLLGPLDGFGIDSLSNGKRKFTKHRNIHFPLDDGMKNILAHHCRSQIS